MLSFVMLEMPGRLSHQRWYAQKSLEVVPLFVVISSDNQIDAQEAHLSLIVRAVLMVACSI